MAKTRIPQDLQIWVDTRKKFHLSHEQIQMARELGLNPRKFGKLANHRQERWKLPLPEFIEDIYFKHFGKRKPERIVTIEQRAKEIARKKREKRALKALRQSAAHAGETVNDTTLST